MAERGVIRRLLYRSRQAYDFGADDLLRLLLAARRDNAERDITGLLLFREGSFMQLLEGAAADVDALYAQIARDPRHCELEMLQALDAAERMMPGWRMAYAQAPQLDGEHVFAGLVSDAGALQLLQRAADADDGRAAAAIMAGFLAGVETSPGATGAVR